jgi:hypothetical protein
MARVEKAIPLYVRATTTPDGKTAYGVTEVYHVLPTAPYYPFAYDAIKAAAAYINAQLKVEIQSKPTWMTSAVTINPKYIAHGHYVVNSNCVMPIIHVDLSHLTHKARGNKASFKIRVDQSSTWRQVYVDANDPPQRYYVKRRDHDGTSSRQYFTLNILP